MRYSFSPTSFPPLVLLYVLASTLILGADSSICTKFSINGSTTTGYYFARHRFYDFRRIDTTIIAPDDYPNLSNSIVSKSVNDMSWKEDWDISVKPMPGSTDSTVPMQFTANNVYIG